MDDGAFFELIWNTVEPVYTESAEHILWISILELQYKAWV